MIGVNFTNGENVYYVNAVSYEYEPKMSLFLINTQNNKRIMIPRENVLDIGKIEKIKDGEFVYE